MNSTIRLYARSWHFWAVVVLLAVGTILHYPQQLPIVGGDLPSSLLHLERHSGERIIFFVAIVYGGLMFGLRPGLVIAAVSLAAMTPRFWLSAAPADAVVETLFTVVVGVLVIGWFNAYQIQKRRLERAVSELQAARDQLHAGLQASKQGEPAKVQGRRRGTPELTGDTVQGLAALSREFEGLSQRIEKVQERVDQILAGMSRSG
jgi:hypothetical protein